MVGKEHYLKLWHYERTGFFVSIFVAIITILIDPIFGILFGVSVSLLIFVNNISHGHFELKVNSFEEGIVDSDSGVKLKEIKENADVLLYSFSGKLCYINSQAHLERFETNLKKYKIIIDLKSPKFAVDSLINLLDINRKNIVLKKNKRLKITDVLIPSFPHTQGQSTLQTNIYNPSVIQKINSISKRKTTLTSVKRNFIISRKKTTQRRIINTDIILEKYIDKDFEIVFLEDLSFVEQMQLFRNAGIIIATHGAGLTNLIFCEKPIIVEFFPTNRYNRDAFYFYQITSELKFPHYIIEYEAINFEQDLFLDEKPLKYLDKIITEHNND